MLQISAVSRLPVPIGLYRVVEIVDKPIPNRRLDRRPTHMLRYMASLETIGWDISITRIKLVVEVFMIPLLHSTTVRGLSEQAIEITHHSIRVRILLLGHFCVHLPPFTTINSNAPYIARSRGTAAGAVLPRSIS